MTRRRLTLLTVEVDASWQSLASAVLAAGAVLWLAYWWVM